MLQEKRKDLDAEKRKKLLQRLLGEVGRDAPDLYYRSTSDIAQLIRTHIDQSPRLGAADKALVRDMSPRDIAVVLSLH